MVNPLFASLAVLIALFAGINVGGSSIGESFGPTVGSDVITVRQASALMSVFIFLGGVLVAPNVVQTLGHGFVAEQYFTFRAALGILLFTGVGILLGNLREVPVSTSETAVGAVAGLGAALQVLQWNTLFRVMAWWIVAPVMALWLSSFVGRYLYEWLEARLRLSQSGRSRLGKVLVIGVACYMGFSSGASNVANAVAPLVGSGFLTMTEGVLLGAGAMSIGAFTIGPRTMETVGDEITDLTLTGAFIIELIAGTIITLLSLAGIPASLAITTITCVIGLGWGQASRDVPLSVSLGMAEASEDERRHLEQLESRPFNPLTTRRVVITWAVSPTVAFVLSFGVFKAAKFIGLLR